MPASTSCSPTSPRAGVRCAAATSKLRGAAEAALRLTGLDAYLSGPQALVTLEDTAEHKPDPAPLRLAVERMGGSVAEAVYVGDAVVDVRAARAAGMAAVAVTWGAGARVRRGRGAARRRGRHRRRAARRACSAEVRPRRRIAGAASRTLPEA